ncbi:MAG TPA: arylesterase [Rhodocyclaceae bacterium]|nr:arylesterase [Rhodocyclaceae bacterium]
MAFFSTIAGAVEQRSLLVFGDSLSSGYGMDSYESWPALLQERLQKSGYAVEVINASRKGETSGRGLERLQNVLDSRRPTWVLLALGANDGLNQSPVGIMKKNLVQMVQMIRASGATPILIGMELPPTYDRRYAMAFRAAFAETAQETATPFVPFLLRNIVETPEYYFMADHLHPSAEAQPRLLDVVWPVVAPLLSEQMTGTATMKAQPAVP